MEKLLVIFEQIKEQFLARWEQFQDSETYLQLKEKYDNLSPLGQKSLIALSVFFVFLFIFVTPYSWYATSEEYVLSFEDNKNLITNLLDVSQEAKKIPQHTQKLSSSDLKNRMDKILQDKWIPKEQIERIAESQFKNPQGSNLIPHGIDQNGVELNIKKLTLKQIVDLGYEFERISPMVKTLSLEMKASPENPHYYNTEFKISSFSVPDAPQPTQKNERARKWLAT